MSEASDGAPEGEIYDWFIRSRELLEAGDANAALTLIERVIAADPQATAALEIRARALFDARLFDEAVAAFTELTLRSPDDDYAHYGLGLSLWRLQRFTEAADELALAAVMRPDQPRYSSALQQVRATLRARLKADLPLSGPIDPKTASSPVTPGMSISDVWPGPAGEATTRPHDG